MFDSPLFIYVVFMNSFLYIVIVNIKLFEFYLLPVDFRGEMNEFFLNG